MNKLFLLTLLSYLPISVLLAQPEKLFEYSDSTFELESVHFLPLLYCFNGGNLERCDSSNISIIENTSIFILNHPRISFQIESHTSSRGSFEYNQALSKARAEALEHILVYRYNVDSLRLRATGYGEKYPLISDQHINQMNIEEECMLEGIHALNRRTLIRVVQIEE